MLPEKAFGRPSSGDIHFVVLANPNFLLRNRYSSLHVEMMDIDCLLHFFFFAMFTDFKLSLYLLHQPDHDSFYGVPHFRASFPRYLELMKPGLPLLLHYSEAMA